MPGLSVYRGPTTERYLRLHGKSHVYYYYAQNWLFCVLYAPTPEEKELLRTRLGKQDKVQDTKEGGVRFHVASDEDLAVLQKIVLARVKAAGGSVGTGAP